MSSQPQVKMSNHKPYPPTMAGLGLQPTVRVDVPILSIFLILFLIGAVVHMTILQVNLRRGKKFIMSGMIFGFCMARITACTLRMVWATHPHNVSVAIAAQIFVAAGVVLLFIINIIFAQRILRATHPRLGWAKPLSMLFKAYYTSIILVIIVIITGVIQSFYTRDRNILRIDRDLMRFGGTYFAISAFIPIILVILNFAIPAQSSTEKFGSGRFTSKIWILLFASAILTLGAAFRAGVSYMPRPIQSPAWYHSKACFYLFNFTIEWTVVALYAALRVDKRFIVPNKSRGPGDYSRRDHQEDGATDKARPNILDRVLSEEEVFDGQTGGHETLGSESHSEKDVEAQRFADTN
ncbi:hypothetical protein B0O99DRAFT_214421 [Bisporella sp. PMI_857]|nr:hypothetical protein B0O99DRAFT_214421 [Bisporella sp. PMI_857]